MREAWPKEIHLKGHDLSIAEVYELARMKTDEAYYAYELHSRKAADDAILRARMLIKYWDKVMV